MKRPANYNTRQREAILEYLRSLKGTHITAAQIVGHFQKERVKIGRPTVYRHLDSFVESGQVRKYTTDGVTGACYQFTGNTEGCHEHFHLKCEDCGVLLHLECDLLGDIEQHVLEEHAFKLNALKTVFYGKCKTCLQA